jgi:hypothetical protein
VNLGDMTNMALWRLRAAGVNFGGAPANGPTDQDPPYAMTQLFNEGYGEVLALTKDYPLAAVKLWVPSVAQAQRYSLQPVPPNPLSGAPLAVNPYALCVYEMTYFMGSAGLPWPPASLEYWTPIVSTAKFRGDAGAYTRRNSYYGPRPLIAAQLFGEPFLDVLPGTAEANDWMTFTVCPDILATGSTLPAANGGTLQNATDVPLFPAEFHKALIEYVIWVAADAADKTDQSAKAEQRFGGYIERMLEFGAARGEGDPEQRVLDTWAIPANPLLTV